MTKRYASCFGLCNDPGFRTLLFLTTLFLCSCAPSRKITPATQFGAQELQKDYRIFRGALEENHPSLYWYTSKEAMDSYFEAGYNCIRDSMTLMEFRNLLSYTVSKVNCGHTTISFLNVARKPADSTHRKRFPLSIKFWQDSAAIYANLNRNDTLLKRGVLLTAINDRDIGFYRDSLFQFISSDGYNVSNKYQSLSNYNGFGAAYKNVFGLTDSLKVTYLDNAGLPQTIVIPAYDPRKDSLEKKLLPRYSRKERRQLGFEPADNLRIDTTGKMAVLTLTTFLNGNGIRPLIKKSFRKLRKQGVSDLVIDVRNNGGGEVSISTLLSAYIAPQKFKLADSLYAINKKSRYGKYIGHYWRTRLFMTFLSKKREDGRYHFGYFERHYFKPKKKDHFNGNVYVLTGGNSFSATTLFVNAVKRSPEVTIIGEETGGGAYGNTAWLIPMVKLPATGLRCRLPLFRLVQCRDCPKTGHGVFPDIEVHPTIEDIRKGVDPKLEKALELIRQKG